MKSFEKYVNQLSKSRNIRITLQAVTLVEETVCAARDGGIPLSEVF